MTNFNAQDTFQVHMIVTSDNSEGYQASILNDDYLSFSSASHLLNNTADRYVRAQRRNNLTRSFYLVDQTGYGELIRTVSC